MALISRFTFLRSSFSAVVAGLLASSFLLSSESLTNEDPDESLLAIQALIIQFPMYTDVRKGHHPRLLLERALRQKDKAGVYLMSVPDPEDGDRETFLVSIRAHEPSHPSIHMLEPAYVCLARVEGSPVYVQNLCDQVMEREKAGDEDVVMFKVPTSIHLDFTGLSQEYVDIDFPALGLEARFFNDGSIFGPWQFASWNGGRPGQYSVHFGEAHSSGEAFEKAMKDWEKRHPPAEKPVKPARRPLQQPLDKRDCILI